MRSKVVRPALAGLFGVLCTPSVVQAGPAVQAEPGAEEAAVFVIRAAELHLRPGEVRENTSVLVRDGRILQIGADIAPPEGAQVIEGAVVCAAFIDPWSALGVDGPTLIDTSLVESARTSDALDFFEGDHLRAEALRAGVTAARLQAGFKGKNCGLGAVARLDPELDDPSAAVLLDDADLAMSVGLSVQRQASFQRMPDGSFQLVSGDAAMDVFDRIGAVDSVVSAIESGASYRKAEVEFRYELEEWEKAIAEKVEELEDDFKKAKKDRDKDIEEAEEKGKEFKEKKYKEDKKPRKPRFDADKAELARVAEGEIPLIVEVHRSAEIRKLLADTERFSRLRLVIAGGSEAGTCAEELARRRVPVIVWPSLRGTQAKDEFEGAKLSLAAELAEAGVEVLLGTGGRDGEATRDLPLLAQLAVGHGLDREAAFEALTLGAARTFDVADRLGSVEVGKDADLLVLDGPPLGPSTRVQYVFCGGRLAVTPQDQ